MKKLLILALVLCFTLGLAACGTQTNEPTSDDPATSIPARSGNADESKENDQAKILPAETEEPNMDISSEKNDAPDDTAGSKILVAYFSCTGNTQGVAEKIAASLNADLYEIMPVEPYTDADLNYNDSSSRATVEQNDDSARPAISDSVENMADYDIVFVGYPIWWGEAPRIMSTFIESYDFSGKTLVAFCTSGSSGFGSSDSALQSAADGAVWLDGRRFSAGTSVDDIVEWVNGLGLNLAG